MTTSQKRETVHNVLIAELRDLRSGKFFVYCYSKISIALKYSTNGLLKSPKGSTSIITNEGIDRLLAEQT